MSDQDGGSFSDSPSPLDAVRLVPMIGGMALSQILGIGWLLFALLGGGSYFILTKILHGHRTRLIPALTIVGVHVGWMLISFAVNPALAIASMSYVDIALFLLLATWIAVRPGMAPAIAFIVFELASLAVNGFAMSQVTSWTPPFNALIFHIILRAAVIFLLVQWMRIRSDEHPEDLAGVFE
ncbi:MAG: hypothetical protein RL367_1675 [Pseudomonadota bacterium]|jgi:hypothetical protein